MISLKPGAAEVQYTADGDYIAAPENAPKPVFDYAITPDTEMKGTIKPGTRVIIRYTQVGTGDTAPKTAVSVDPVW
jgi:hypothetical protein